MRRSYHGVVLVAQVRGRSVMRMIGISGRFW